MDRLRPKESRLDSIRSFLTFLARFDGAVSRPVLQREEEGSTASWLGFGPDLAPVTIDDSLHGSQSDAGPLEVFLAVKPLEYPKEFIGVFRIEAHSVIPHKERQGTVGRHVPISITARCRARVNFAALESRLEKTNSSSPESQ